MIIRLLLRELDCCPFVSFIIFSELFHTSFLYTIMYMIMTRGSIKFAHAQVYSLSP